MPAPSIFAPIFDEQFGEVGDLRLERTIFENCFAFSEHCGGKNIFRACDRNFWEAERCAAEALGARFHVAVVHRNLGAQFLKRLNVQVNGPSADRAAAGKRNARVAESRDERAKRENRGAHCFYEFVGSFGVRNGFGLNG